MRSTVVSAALAAAVVAGPAVANVPPTIRVGNCPNATFSSIQNALDAAPEGATVVVCPGLYDEQLVVTKRLRLRGMRGAVVRPHGMTANTTSVRTGRPIAAVVVLRARAIVDRLEIDASLNGFTDCDDTESPLLMGVFFRNTGGALKRSEIHGVRLGEADADCDNGAAVYVQAGASPLRATIAGNVVYDYQRAGIVVSEPGATAVVRGNRVTGDGPTATVAQNGIQVAFGATARVVGNVVQNNHTPTTAGCFFDGGNLIYDANRGRIVKNTFTGNTAGVLVTGSANLIARNVLDGESGGTPVGLDGIAVFGNGNTVNANRVRNMSQAGIMLVGSRNRARGNTIAETHAAPLCETLRSANGDCSELLTVCGVGLWIAGGSGNVAVGNSFSGNDVDLRNDGAATRGRRRRYGRERKALNVPSRASQ